MGRAGLLQGQHLSAVTDGRTNDIFRLYYAPGTCALATRIALEEAGAPYEAVLVDFRSQSQRSPEYLPVNPKGRVPALVTESGTLTETPALLCFVPQCFPQAELAPLEYMICDPYLFTVDSWIEGDGVDTTKLPQVMEHRVRMLARPAVQNAVAAEGTQIP
jgi:glutathione S-transferase